MPHPFLKLLFLLGIFLTTNSSVNAQDDQLSFGVFPYVSASKLIKHQSAIHLFLRKQINQEIDIVTAQNFKVYTDRVLNSEYDLIFAPPHLARYCEKNGLYTPLALTQTKIQGIYLTHKDSTVRTIEDLQGHHVSVSTVGFEYSLLYQIMIEQMKSLSINTLHFREVSAHNNSIFSVYKKDVDVALTGIKIWKTLAPDIKANLRSIGKTHVAPGFVIMARPSLARTLSALFRHVKEDFKKSLVSGKYIFKGLITYQNNMLENMDPYIQPFEKQPRI